MPLPDVRFIESPSLQNLFRDKDTALPLSAGVVTFYSDVNRTVKKDIYEQVRLPDNTYDFVLLNNPLTLSSIGAYADNNGNDINIYLYPYLGAPTDPVQGPVELYYITVEAAVPPVGTGALQFIREAWPPNFQGSSSPTDVFEGTTNELSNPQFSVVNFRPITGYTVSVTSTGEVTEIAPDWALVTSGTGTVTVKHIAVSDTNAPSNPPYALDIASSGITSLHLRQRLTESPRLLKGAFVSGTFVAKSLDAAQVTISMNYMPTTSSTATLFQEICSGTTSSGAYTTIANSTAVQIILVNTTDAPAGYVDIYLDIPVNTHVQISSVQIVSVQNADSSTEYLQQSNAREIDHLFHYYKPELEFKPIPSLLTAWNFALNPAQWGEVQTVTTTPSYIWDQTIMASAVNNVAIARSPEDKGALAATTTVDNEAFYILQYLSGPEAIKTTESDISAIVTGYTLLNKPNPTVTIHLYHGDLSSTIPVLPTTIGTISVSSGAAVFTLTAANWSEIETFPVGNGTSGEFFNAAIGDVIADTFKAAFNHGAVKNFAIVVTFFVPTSATEVIIDSVGLCQGEIATRPGAQTSDDVLRECQYYYEQSYSSGTAAGSATTVNSKFLQMNALSQVGSAFADAYASPFEVQFSSIKRVSPTLTFYSVAGAANNVSANLYYALTGTNAFTHNGPSNVPLASFWTSPTTGTKQITYAPNTVTSLVHVTNSSSSASFAYASAGIQFHYTADARLGVV